jgi:hypothetical protein
LTAQRAAGPRKVRPWSLAERETVLLLRRGVDLLDFLPGVDLVANRLQARGQLGDGERDGGAAGQVSSSTSRA